VALLAACLLRGIVSVFFGAIFSREALRSSNLDLSDESKLDLFVECESLLVAHGGNALFCLDFLSWGKPGDFCSSQARIFARNADLSAAAAFFEGNLIR
jgi:hypothetical protein